MPVLPQKTEADSVAALHTRDHYQAHCWPQLLFQSYITAGCCMRIAYQLSERIRDDGRRSFATPNSFVSPHADRALLTSPLVPPTPVLFYSTDIAAQ